MHAAAVDTVQRLLSLASDDESQIDALIAIARSQHALDHVEEAIDLLAEAVALEGPNGHGAGELARLATAPHHWECYVVALRDYMSERQPKGRTFAVLYLEIART